MPSNTLGQVEQSLGLCRHMTKPVLLLTRPASRAQQFVGTLAPALLARVTVLISPLMQIIATGRQTDMVGYAGAVFTSANGVLQGPEGKGRPAYCVGNRTAEAASKEGWSALMMGQDADQLVESLSLRKTLGPLLHIGGVHQRGEIASRLTSAGLKTDMIAVYDQVLLPLDKGAKVALGGDVPCIVPLFSPRTAQQFVKECPDMRQVVAIALSDAVAETLQDRPLLRMMITSEPTAISMRCSLETALDWIT